MGETPKTKQDFPNAKIIIIKETYFFLEANNENVAR